MPRKKLVTISHNEPQKAKQRYTWTELESDIAGLASTVRELNMPYDTIYGIPRGGLIPAVILSHRLRLPLVMYGKITKRTLIIDDIIDTGFTVKKLRNKLGKFRCPNYIFALFGRDLVSRTEIILRLTKKWVQFPWETQVSSKYDGTFSKGRKNTN